MNPLIGANSKWKYLLLLKYLVRHPVSEHLNIKYFSFCCVGHLYCLALLLFNVFYIPIMDHGGIVCIGQWVIKKEIEFWKQAQMF